MLTVILLMSLLLGLLSLAGIAWIVIVGSLLTVDGLFMTLILLTLTSIFFLNVFLELRDRGSARESLRRRRCVPSRVRLPHVIGRREEFRGSNLRGAGHVALRRVRSLRPHA